MSSVESIACSMVVVEIGSSRPQETAGTADRPNVFSSVELLQGRREAWIEHGDQMYRLRLTQAGKLYLTK